MSLTSIDKTRQEINQTTSNYKGNFDYSFKTESSPPTNKQLLESSNGSQAFNTINLIEITKYLD